MASISIRDLTVSARNYPGQTGAVFKLITHGHDRSLVLEGNRVASAIHFHEPANAGPRLPKMMVWAIIAIAIRDGQIDLANGPPW